MITRIKLKNWRSHLDTTLDFSEGTNALIGIMGSGKTSALDALCFALFGTFPTAASKKVCLEDVISKKPKEANEAEVAVFFELGDNEWMVKRAISRVRATSAELRRKVGGEWQLVEGPQPSKVTEEIERLLKVDYDLFTRAIYSEQNELDTFLTIPRGQRMRKIDQLLAIDRFERARQTVLTLSSRCSRAADEKAQLLAALEGSGIAALPQLTAELEQLQQEKKRLETGLASQLESRTSLERQLSELRARRDVYLQLVHELETAKALLSQTEADIDALKRELTAEEIAYSEMTTADLQTRVEQAAATEQLLRANREAEERRLNDLRGVIARKTAKISVLEADEIPRLRASIEEREKLKAQLRRLGPKKLQNEIEACSKNIDRARAAAQRAQLQMEQVEAGLHELAKVGASCPVCDRALSDRKKANLAQHKREVIEKMKAQAARFEATAYELTEELARLENQLRDARLLEARLEASSDSDQKLKFCQDLVQQYRSELEGHGTEARMLEKTLRLLETELEASHAATERLRGVLGKRTSLAGQLARSRELQERINGLSARRAQVRVVTQGELEHLENELAHAISSSAAYETRLASLSALANEKQARLAELQARLQELERMRAEAARLTALASQFRLLEAALTATQAQLRTHFTAAVNQAMHTLWGYLYPYKDFWSCRLAIEEGDYVLQLADSTGWIPADGLASGGERAMACLALRMAFALVLAPQLRWLVLDEPTHNLDSRAVEDLATVLHDRIGEFVDQVFLITHDPALEAAVSGYLYRLERDKEKDSPTAAVRVAGPDN